MSDALARTHPPDADIASVPHDMMALAVAAWLDSKHGRSGSICTRATYAAILADFRTALGRADRDLTV